MLYNFHWLEAIKTQRHGLARAVSMAISTVSDLSILGFLPGQPEIFLKAATSLQKLELYESFGFHPGLLDSLPRVPTITELIFSDAPIPYLSAREQIKLHTKPKEHHEMPISSESLIDHLNLDSGRLKSLHTLVLPEKSRFKKRGHWMNNTTKKHCRNKGVQYTQTPLKDIASSGADQ